MEDKAEVTSTEKEKNTAVGNLHDYVLHTSTVVPNHIRRFLYLGKESGIYRAQADNPRGFVRVSSLGFNYLKAWDLGIFSDEMLEEYLNENKDVGAPHSEESLFKNNERKTIPKDGWPSTNMVHLVKEILTSHKGACRPAALFILAACSRSKGPARQEAYSFVKDLESPEDILLYVKYAMDLTPKHKGWGGGIRRAINSWYKNRCGSLELAENIVRIRQRHAWSHKDVLKLIHGKPKDAVHGMVIGYAMFGLDKACEIYKEVPDNEELKMEAMNVMNYLKAADKLRKLRIPKGSNVECSQVLEAVGLIKAHKFTVDFCDDTLLIAPKIWEAALEHMTFWQLLVYLPILRFNRVTKIGCELTKVILKKLKAAFDALTQVSDKKIFPPVSPGLVLISMQTYRRKHVEVVPTKLWFRTHALVKDITEPKPQASSASVKNSSQRNGDQKHTGIPRGVAKPNTKVLELLSKIMVVSIKNMKPTGKRFIFGVGNIQEKARCLINPYVVSFEAAALTYMCLEAAEADGTVAAFGVPVDGITYRKLRGAGTSLSNCAREIMQGMSTGPLKVDGWLDWLCKENYKADVIVLMADEVLSDNESSTNLFTAFTNYKKSLKLSKVKLIIVSFVSDKLPEYSDFQDDALMIHGFDSNLPFIIQHFARGCF